MTTASVLHINKAYSAVSRHWRFWLCSKQPYQRACHNLFGIAILHYGLLVVLLRLSRNCENTTRGETLVCISCWSYSGCNLATPNLHRVKSALISCFSTIAQQNLPAPQQSNLDDDNYTSMTERTGFVKTRSKGKHGTWLIDAAVSSANSAEEALPGPLPDGGAVVPGTLFHVWPPCC